MYRFEDFDNSLGRAAVEVVDVQDDPVDRRQPVAHDVDDLLARAQRVAPRASASPRLTLTGLRAAEAANRLATAETALATVMLMASRDPDKVGMWAAAITVTMAITTLVLLAGTKLHRWLGEHAMHAIERLMGLILTAIAVEMLLAGIREFVKGLH